MAKNSRDVQKNVSDYQARDQVRLDKTEGKVDLLQENVSVLKETIYKKDIEILDQKHVLNQCQLEYQQTYQVLNQCSKAYNQMTEGVNKVKTKLLLGNTILKNDDTSIITSGITSTEINPIQASISELNEIMPQSFSMGSEMKNFKDLTNFISNEVSTKDGQVKKPKA